MYETNELFPAKKIRKDGSHYDRYIYLVVIMLVICNMTYFFL